MISSALIYLTFWRTRIWNLGWMLMLVFSLAITCQTQELQWRQIGSPISEGQGFPFTDDPTKMVEVGDNIVLIGSSASGMLRFTPNEERWDLANHGLPTDTILYVSTNPAKDTAICTLKTGAAYASANEGKTWNYFINTPVPGMYIEHAGDGVYIAWSREHGVYRTEDVGKNWTQIYERNGYDRQMTVHAYSSAVCIVGTLENGIYRSTDGGRSWSQPYPITVHVQSFTRDRYGDIYAGTKFGIVLSTDMGATWNKVPTPNNVVHEAFNIALCDSGMFMPYKEKLYYTGDSGKTWRNFNDFTENPFAPPLNIWDVLATSNNRIYARSRYYSLNRDIGSIDSYLPSLHNVKYSLKTNIRSIVSIGDRIITPGLISRAGNAPDYTFFEYLFPDGDSTKKFTNLFQSDGGTLWICSFYDIFVSYDSATSFKLFKGMGARTNPYNGIAVRPPNRVLIHANDSVQFSHDEGQSWINSWVLSMVPSGVYLSSKGTPFVESQRKQIFRSPDNCQTWKLVLEANYHEDAHGVLSNSWNGDLYCGTHKSTDDGLTWEDIPGIDGRALINTWYFDSSGITWIATRSGLFWKEDTSTEWNFGGLDGNILAFHAMYNGNYVATTEEGLFFSDGFSNPTAVETVSIQTPTSFSLSAPYPNPFTESATVSFTTNGRTEVTLAVYNALGRRVATLADATFNPGTYTLNWDGRTNEGMPLPPGSYYVRMATPDGVQSMRVLKVR